MKKLILLGTGGHALVILDALEKINGIQIIGFTDKNYLDNAFIKKYSVLGTDDKLIEIYNNKKADYAFIAVGSTGDNYLRKELYDKIISIGYKSLNIIHPNSIIAKDVSIGQGNLVAASSVINPLVVIKNNNIINTGSIIEHGCYIGNHVHIAPGCVLAGNVHIGDLSHIGLGTKVIEGITIGKNCIIGAGSVIINDIPDNSVVVGVPGRIIRKRGECNE